MSSTLQFVKFAAGGAVGTACHYAILISLVELLDAPIPVASACGFAVGAITNYVIARNYVFRSRRSHRSALPRFVCIALLGAVVNTALISLLAATGMHYLIAQAGATLAVLFLNFVANRLWTFAQ